MNGHATINRIYRLVWSDFLGAWMAVAENAKGRGKSSVGSTARLVALCAAIGIGMPPAIAGPPAPTQLPTGGQVVAGSASISQSAATLNISQSSNRAAIDWSTFNVGSQAQVNFKQPGSSSVTLNRVLDANPSQIFGKITAPGQVFLSNPNGVYFAPGASVDVGGLVATTHSIATADFMAGSNSFTRNGATGSVVNDGNITASLGGYIALLAPEARNSGVIVAQLGTVVLAAGDAYELQFDGNNTLANIRVTPASIAALVENGHAVQAPGGLIILSAQAANRLQGGVVNNSGMLEANGLSNTGGVIRLEASDRISHSGSINVDAAANSAGKGGTATLIADLANAGSTADINGSISARGGDLGGDGGFVETSGGRVRIGSTTRVDTLAPQGKTGNWLIDPTDFTIAAGSGSLTGSGMGASTLQTALGSADVSIATSAANTGSELGDINVNAAVSWSAHKLTLTAHNDININAVMTASGSSLFDLEPGSGKVNVGFNADGTFKGRVDFPGRSGTDILTIGGTGYTVINSLGLESDTTGTDQTLQGMERSANLSGKFALGSDIDASATSNWKSGTSMEAGFSPIGAGSWFDGMFNGLGHTITALTSHGLNPGSGGLFQAISASSGISNVGLVNADIKGGSYSGGLVGTNQDGSISNSYVTGSIVSNAAVNAWSSRKIGGLVGANYGNGKITNSYAKVNITGNLNNIEESAIGGLVGYNEGTIINSYAKGNITSTSTTGSGYGIGGLVGSNYGTINNSHATGVVSVSGSSGVGGLVGFNYDGAAISNSYAMGIVRGVSKVGGLVGDGNYSLNSIITNSYYNIDSANVNNGKQVTRGGLYTAQFADWLGSTDGHTSAVKEAQSLNVASYLGAPNVAGYYVIGNEQNLKDMLGFADNPAYKFQMSANITLATPGFHIPYFTAAEFDGNGKTISGLLINQPNSDYVGMFGYEGADAKINNLGIINASVKGYEIVGGLVGNAYSATIDTSYASAVVEGHRSVGGLVGSASNSTISNSYATGEVKGDATSYYVGGLVGFTSGTIRNSYATGAVTGSTEVGGLVGYSSGNATIHSSYASGAVTGGANVGGLVGYGYGRINIDNSYATGVVAGSDHVGGLVGFECGTDGNYVNISNSYATGKLTGSSNVGGLTGNNFGTVSNSFYDKSVNGVVTGISGSNDVAGTVWGMSTVEMKDKLNFTTANVANGNVNPGWDFAVPVWKIFSTANDGYPCLAWSADCLASGGTPLYLRLIIGSSTYGNAPTLTYALYDASSGGTAKEDANPSGTVTWSNPLSAASSAATYGETYSSGITLGNASYTLSAGGSIDWTINPRPLNVAVSKTYNGSAAFNSGFVLSGMVNSDSHPVVSGSASVASANATTYNSFSSSTLALDNGNYTLTGGTVAASIDKAAATVTGNSASKTYTGVSQSASGFTATGLVHGEAASVLTGVSASGSGTNAGSYSVVPTGTDANYTLSFVNGSLVIAKAAATVTGNSAAKTYDGLAYQGGNGLVVSGFVNSEGNSLVSGTPVYTGNAQGATNAGAYTISVAGLTAGNNYSLSFVNGQLLISKAHLTVTANDANRFVGSVNPAFTATLSGFVHGETLATSAVSGSAALSTSADITTPVGTAAIVAKQGSLAAGNYDFASFKDGTLTLSAAYVPPPNPVVQTLPGANTSAGLTLNATTITSTVDDFNSAGMGSGSTNTGSTAATGGSAGSSSSMPTAVVEATLSSDSRFSFTVPRIDLQRDQIIDSGRLAVARPPVATMGNGAALPGWLKFNPNTGVFSGVAPPGVKEIVVNVIRSDSSGARVSTLVHLHFAPPTTPVAR